MIRIPEQYRSGISATVTVTLVNTDKPVPNFKSKTRKFPSSIDEFSELKLDTRGWKFDREEANERG
jgi:hypothetical protein